MVKKSPDEFTASQAVLVTDVGWHALFADATLPDRFSIRFHHGTPQSIDAEPFALFTVPVGHMGRVRPVSKRLARLPETGNLAFSLTGIVVPEPTPVACGGFGFFFLFVRRRDGR